MDLDEDVLEAARQLAKSRKTSIGRVLSELARSALAPEPATRSTRNGVPLLAPRPGARPVTLELVNRLRDEPG